MLGLKMVRETCRSVYLGWPDQSKYVVSSKVFGVPPFNTNGPYVEGDGSSSQASNTKKLGPGLFFAILIVTDSHRIPFWHHS